MSSEIVVDGEVISIPSEILENPSILCEILTNSTWQNELNDEQRMNLSKLLPSSSQESDEKEETIRMLLSGKDLSSFSEPNASSSGNPVEEFSVLLRQGHFSPESYRLRRCYRRMCKAREKLFMCKRNHQLFKEVIVSRQCHLEVAADPRLYRISKVSNVAKMLHSNQADNRREIEETANLSYLRILNEVCTEARLHPDFEGKDITSSDSDTEAQASAMTNLTRMSMPFNHTVTPLRYREMLLQHKRRRDAKVNTPDLNVSGIKLVDVMSRTFVGGRKMQGLLGKKRKTGDLLKLTKQKKLKSSSKPEESLLRTKPTDAASEKKTARSRVKHNNSHKFTTQPGCFFELIRDVLFLSQDKTKSSVQQLVGGWLVSAEASRYVWTITRNNWGSLVDSALDYLTQGHNGDFPLVAEEKKGDDVKLRWLGATEKVNEDEKEKLKKLCLEWSAKLPSLPQDGAVASPSNDVTSFQTQERRRYQFPHQAFVYTIGGVRYPVPPVKGSTGPTKEGRVAREHCLLRSERPPQVTLLALTRDAVARLPGGTGTRNDVCNLIRESQYLAEVITDAQINAAVSGALDRLHYEPDPCVRFDSSARLWVYLHSDRSVQDLERLHAEQLGAPKKKRQKEKTKKAKSKATEDDAGNSNRSSKKKSVMNSDESDVKPVTITNVGQSSLPGSTTTNPQFKIEPLLHDKPANVINSADVTSAGTGGTTTIHLTPKQLIEMTRMVPSAYQGAREVLITQRGSSAVVRPNDGQSGHQGVALQRGVKVPQANGQPSLKLILKPATGDQQKPTAELVRVVEPNKQAPSQAQPGKQHVLTAEAIRRLSEQLSAASSRPIKIVQQPMQTDAKLLAAGDGAQVISISQPRPFATSSGKGNAVDLKRADPRRIVMTGPVGSAQSPVATSQLGGNVTTTSSGASTLNPSSVATGVGGNVPVSMSTSNVMQASHNPKTKTLQFMSGGRIQTVQVLSNPTANSSSREIIITQPTKTNHVTTPTSQAVTSHKIG